jgi:3-oxoadipate enol-lactonase
MEPFAERYRVVRPDLRGFGDSPLPGAPFSYVEDVRALIDHLGLDRVGVVANSFGGKVALDFTLEHPERVGALVLIAPALSGWEGSPDSDAFEEEEDALLDAGKLDEAVDLNLRTWLDGDDRGAAPISADLRERVADMQRRAFVTIVAAYERTPPPGPVSWPEPPAATRLDEVVAPTLVIACTHDQPDFRRIAARVAAGIPGAESAKVATGHLPGVERPEELNPLVLDFFDRRF